MKTPARLAGTLPALLLLGGCYKQAFVSGPGASMNAPVVYERSHHHFVWGLVGPGEAFDASQFCPSGNMRIEQEQTFVNGLVAALTSGIYVPRTVRVRCDRSGGAADIELLPEKAKQIVFDPAFLDWVRETNPKLFEAAQAAQAAPRSR